MRRRLRVDAARVARAGEDLVGHGEHLVRGRRWVVALQVPVAVLVGALGLALVLTGEPGGLVIGVPLLLITLLLLAYVVPRLLGRRDLVVARDGLRFVRPGLVVAVPWAEVGVVDVLVARNNVRLAIEIADRDLASALNSPALRVRRGAEGRPRPGPLARFADRFTPRGSGTGTVLLTEADRDCSGPTVLALVEASRPGEGGALSWRAAFQDEA